MKKRASELKVGDKTEWYTILKVERDGNKVVAKVRFNDGGTGERVWDDPNTEVPVS